MGFGKGGTGAIIRQNESVSLGTLANNTALKLTNGVTLTEDFRILKSEIIALYRGLTTGEGEGLMLGICNGELSVAEIAEALTVDGPGDRNDRVNQEQAERAVWIIATPGFGTGAVGASQVNLKGPNGSTIIEWKKRWTFSDPEGWDFFVFNLGTALTTGGNCNLLATNYGVWVT